MPLPPIAAFFPHRPWASPSRDDADKLIPPNPPKLLQLFPSVRLATPSLRDVSPTSAKPVASFDFVVPIVPPLGTPPVAPVLTFAPTLAPPIIVAPDFFSPGFGSAESRVRRLDLNELSVEIPPIAPLLPLAPSEEGWDLLVLVPPLVPLYEDVSEPSTTGPIVEPSEWAMEGPSGFLPPSASTTTGFTPFFEQEPLPSDFWSTVSAFFDCQDEKKYRKRQRRAPDRFQSEPFPTKTAKRPKKSTRRVKNSRPEPLLEVDAASADVDVDAASAAPGAPCPVKSAPAINADVDPADAGLPLIDVSVYDFDE